jgi:uncharacterized damage-inducible protein DinB
MLKFADVLLAEFDREAGLTRRVLARVPANRFDWRPHEKSMTLGRLVTHLAELPGWGASLVAVTEYDLANRPSTDHTEPTLQAALARFDGNVAAARQAIVERTDPELLAPWTLKSEGRELFTAPRLVALRTLLLEHSTHHRGQLTVYLRLLDVPLPPLYGPSADEGRF